MSIEIEGIDDFIVKLDNAIKKIPKKRNEFVKKSAENLINYTKDLTPVDTSNLRNNWQRTRPYMGSIKVYNNTEYAAHVEYGHRVKKRWVPGRWHNGHFIYNPNAKTGMMLKSRFIKGVYMLHQGVEELRDNFEEDAKLIMGDIFD